VAKEEYMHFEGSNVLRFRKTNNQQ
jgi:hypothetical protein